jgi:hypothetical protein
LQQTTFAASLWLFSPKSDKTLFFEPLGTIFAHFVGDQTPSEKGLKKKCASDEPERT